MLIEFSVVDIVVMLVRVVCRLVVMVCIGDEIWVENMFLNVVLVCCVVLKCVCCSMLSSVCVLVCGVVFVVSCVCILGRCVVNYLFMFCSRC